MKKKIDHLSHLLEKNNIGVPDSIKQSSSSQDSSKVKDTKDKGKGKALVAVASSSSTPSWVIDSVLGRGSVKVEGGTFINVLDVPSLSTNLLLITNLGYTPSHTLHLILLQNHWTYLDPTTTDRLDETLENIPKDEDSSSINSESSDKDPSPSTPGHSSEDEDSPPDSPTVGPL
eukprot:Gb_37314 [translate_table: standard]